MRCVEGEGGRWSWLGHDKKVLISCSCNLIISERFRVASFISSGHFSMFCSGQVKQEGTLLQSVDMEGASL